MTNRARRMLCLLLAALWFLPAGKPGVLSGAAGEAGEAEEFVITFLPNGGEGEMSPATGEKGTRDELPPNQFTRRGYAFKSWNTRKDGTGKTYRDGKTVTFRQNLTLYAQWKRLPKVRLTLNASPLKAGTDTVTLRAALTLDGKPAGGKKLTFFFRDAFHTAKTDSRGIAKITIRLDAPLRKGEKIRAEVCYRDGCKTRTVTVK